MLNTPLEQKIHDIVTPEAEALGLALCHITLSGANGAQTLQITAENPETGRLSVDKCAELSRAASTILDVEDPISGAYRLEVSSPGIDRLLTREEDFARYSGFDAKLETQMPQESGQKRFRGTLQGIANGVITITTDQGDADIAFRDLKKAKLVLTDELINATAQQKD